MYIAVIYSGSWVNETVDIKKTVAFGFLINCSKVNSATRLLKAVLGNIVMNHNTDD